MNALNKLPRVAKMAVIGAFLIALAFVAKGFSPGSAEPIGVSSTPVAPRTGAAPKPRVTTTTPTLVPPNPSGRNPFAPAK